MKKLLFGIALALGASNAYAQPNLVAHWDFNGSNVGGTSTASPIYENINGSTLTGSVFGSITQVPGYAGVGNTAVQFGGNGIADYIRVPHDPLLDLSSWTIHTLIKINDCNIYGECQKGVVVWKGDEAASDHYSLYLSDHPYDNDCTPASLSPYVPHYCYYSRMVTKAAGYPPVASSLGLSYDDEAYLGYPTQKTQTMIMANNPGAWHCVTASYDGTGHILRLYLDGIKYVEIPWQNQYGTSNVSDLFFGNSNAVLGGGTSDYAQFQGAIDDIKIYDGVFSDADVAALCDVCTGPNVVGHWDFKGGSPNDIGPNSLTTTAIGTFWTSATGINGGPDALDFSGDDYLMVQSHPALNLKSWSITAIVKPRGFNTNLCQTSSILWRSDQWSYNHYGLHFSDNNYDVGDCHAVNTSQNIFSGSVQDPTYSSITPTNIALWQGTPPPTNPLLVASTWYCVAVTYDDNTQLMNLYVNGNHVVVDYQWTTPVGADTDEPLFIGSSSMIGSPFEYFFTGVMDDLILWDGVLCPNQIPTCGGNADEYKVTNVNTLADGELQITPNPANDVLNIIVPAAWKGCKYEMRNMTGIMISSGTVDGTIAIDTKNIPAGIYTVTTNHNGQAATRKVVVTH